MKKRQLINEVRKMQKIAGLFEGDMHSEETLQEAKGNYIFIVFDRYDASKSDVVPIQTSLSPMEAFKYAMEQTEGEFFDEEAYEQEIKPQVKMGNNIVAFDGEETSYLLVKS